MASPPTPTTPTPPLLTPHTLDAVVIGAGLGGIAAAAALLKAGARDVLVLEKGASVGGVWRDSDYPGARCDVPSRLYSYSEASGLSPPGWAWSHSYGSRDEILAYARAAAAGAGVAARTRTRCAVTAAAFEPATGTWAVTFTDRSGEAWPDGVAGPADLDFRVGAAGAAARAGDEGGEGEGGAGGRARAAGRGAPPPPPRAQTVRARALFAATGVLGAPAYPATIAGLLPSKDGTPPIFAGPVLHSARWDWGAALGGKRVVVVGAGAAAAQVVPALLDPALGLRSLTLCVRSPPTVLPKGGAAPLSPWWRALYRLAPVLAPRLVRATQAAKQEVRGWALTGGGPPGAARLAAAAAAAHRAVALRGAPRSMVTALTPRTPLGCKRVLLSDSFLKALAADPRASVETGTLASAAPAALRLADGRSIPADVVVLCTGYVAPAWLAGVEVRGRGGATLAEAWRAAGRSSAFLGATVPGFPNFFMLGGPGSGTGFHSVLTFLEAQVAHAVEALGLLGWWAEEGGGSPARAQQKPTAPWWRRGRAKTASATTPAAAAPPPPPPGSVVEVTPSAAAAFDASLQARLAGSVFPHCRSWYKEGDGGAGPVTAVWPGSAAAFVRRARADPAGDYEVVPPPPPGVGVGAAAAAAAAAAAPMEADAAVAEAAAVGVQAGAGDGGASGLAPVVTAATADPESAAGGGGKDGAAAAIPAPDTPPRQWWGGVRRTRSDAGTAFAINDTCVCTAYNSRPLLADGSTDAILRAVPTCGKMSSVAADATDAARSNATTSGAAASPGGGGGGLDAVLAQARAAAARAGAGATTGRAAKEAAPAKHEAARPGRVAD